MIEVPVRAVVGVVIDENSAAGNVGVVVVRDMAVIPVRSPVVPAPPEAAEEADAKAQAERNPQSGEI